MGTRENGQNGFKPEKKKPTILISPVLSVTSFMHVQKCLTDLPNIISHVTDTPNGKHLEDGHLMDFSRLCSVSSHFRQSVNA